MVKIFIGDEMIEKLIDVTIVISVLVFITFITNFLFKAFVKGRVSQRRETILVLLVNLIKYGSLLIGVFIVLAIFGVDTASVLAGAGLLGILLGFGLQKLMIDIVNGFFIIFENQYVTGEHIGINDIVGEVIELGLKTTKILTYNGEIHFFANGDIKSVVNYSRKNSLAVVDIPVLYEYKVEYVHSILENALEEFEHTSSLDKPRISGVQESTALYYVIRIVCLTRPFEKFDVSRKLRLAVIKAFEENDVCYYEQGVILSK